MKKIAIIGGGASGMMAAIAAAENGAEVTIFEKNDRIGKKILATGNGKCNFSNLDFKVNYYNGTDTEYLPELFAQFSVQDTIAFFQDAGMLCKEKNGYLYPLSEQASTVLDILRLKIKQKKIKVELQANITSLMKNHKTNMFCIQTLKDKHYFHSVILTCGGCAAPKTGSDGSGYLLSGNMGHEVIETVPALVQLKCRDDFMKGLGGVRCEALVSIENKNQVIQAETGEVQFTDYGISGIPVFQFSRTASYLLKKQKEISVYINFFPGYSDLEYEKMCDIRINNRKGKNMEEFLLGMMNKKINTTMLKLADLKVAEEAGRVSKEKLQKLLYSYRRLCVHVTAPNSFDHAQVTAGGVSMKEVNLRMESKLVRDLYFAGEILDIDGRCGGYNLQWAWTSGYIAGKNAGRQ